MSKQIITIGRQYGSGGREIGEKLARRLGVPCHDKAIIERIAREKGYCREVIDQFDESNSKSLLFSLVMNSYGSWYSNNDYKPLQASVREAQMEIIRELAKEPCVIIGRAADSVLGRENCISVFIHAPQEARVQRIMKRQKCSEREATESIANIDRERAQFYKHYSTNKWGDAASYDFTVDSAKLGVDKTVLLLDTYLKLQDWKK